MEAIFNKTSNTLATLSVKIAETDYKVAVNKKIKEYAKTAQIKGFRPGHVPEGMIRARFGKGIKIDEVLDLVNKEISAYIKENKLQVVGDPIPAEKNSTDLDWDNQTEFDFGFELGLASDFEVNIAALPAIKVYDIEPTPEKINESIAEIRKRFGKNENPEISENGDIVFGTLTQSGTDFSSETGIPTERLTETALPTFVGLSKENKVSFDIQTLFTTTKDLSLAIGKTEEEATQLSGTFELEVKEISRSADADLDQDFFDKAVGAGKVSNEEEFRTELAKIIKDNYSRESDYLLKFDVEKALLENTPIELPDEFLKDWLVTANEGKFSREDIEKEYDAFAKGLRLDLIRNRVGEQNEIKVEYADVLEEAKNEVKGYFGFSVDNGMDETITRIAENILKDKENKNASKYVDRAYGEKVLRFVKSQISIENKTIQVSEFEEIAKETFA